MQKSTRQCLVLKGPYCILLCRGRESSDVDVGNLCDGCMAFQILINVYECIGGHRIRIDYSCLAEETMICSSHNLISQINDRYIADTEKTFDGFFKKSCSVFGKLRGLCGLPGSQKGCG